MSFGGEHEDCLCEDDELSSAVDCGAIHALAECLLHGDADVQRGAALCFINGVTHGSLDQTAFFVRCGCLPPLVRATLKRTATVTFVTHALRGENWQATCMCMGGQLVL